MIDEIVSRLEHIPPALLKRLLSGVLWEGTPESGTLALTFDDGPDPEITPRVLDVLDENDARGTFFLVGEKVNKYPELARTIIDRGHVVGNHSMTHRSLFLASSDDISAEIDDAQKSIADAVGIVPHLFRPPHGLFDLTGLKIVRERGLSMTLWTVLAGDYSDDSEKEILSRVEPFVRPGAILVFHDTVQGGGLALPVMIQTLLKISDERVVRADTVEALSFSRDIEVADADS